MKTIKINWLVIATSIFTASVLIFVKLKVSFPIIIFDKIFSGSAYLIIPLFSIYAGFVVSKMQDVKESAKWRKRTWTLFCVVFFLQFILGLFGYDEFLMTGKMHIPVPALIVGGAVYEMKISFMPILFLSTILLSGPAWCSHLCYFGAFDSIASDMKKQGFLKSIKNKNTLKHSFLLLVVLTAIFLRIFDADIKFAIIGGISFGVVGIAIIVFISRSRSQMFHCTVYCPIGTIVSYMKNISPFRMYIDDSCTLCQHCTTKCKYDALNLKDIINKKPAKTCTLCGDCLSACASTSIKYKFFGLKPQNARNLYLFISVSLHAIFLCLARI